MDAIGRIEATIKTNQTAIKANETAIKKTELRQNRNMQKMVEALSKHFPNDLAPLHRDLKDQEEEIMKNVGKMSGDPTNEECKEQESEEEKRPETGKKMAQTLNETLLKIKETKMIGGLSSY